MYVKDLSLFLCRRRSTLTLITGLTSRSTIRMGDSLDSMKSKQNYQATGALYSINCALEWSHRVLPTGSESNLTTPRHCIPCWLMATTGQPISGATLGNHCLLDPLFKATATWKGSIWILLRVSQNGQQKPALEFSATTKIIAFLAIQDLALEPQEVMWEWMTPIAVEMRQLYAQTMETNTSRPTVTS